MRKTFVIAAGVLMLAAVNWGIYARERLLAGGRVVMLELAPVDPRSLMQGDYMALRFKAADDAFGRARGRSGESGGRSARDCRRRAWRRRVRAPRRRERTRRQ